MQLEQLCFQAAFHGALEGVQSPLLEGLSGSSPPSLSWFLKHQQQPVFPLDPVLYCERGRDGRGGERRERMERGGEEERERGNTTQTSNKNQHSAAQLQLLSPQKGRTSMTKLVFRKCSPAWAPPALQLLFASLSQQIACRCTSHLSGLQPPLSETGGEREGK